MKILNAEQTFVMWIMSHVQHNFHVFHWKCIIKKIVCIFQLVLFMV